MLLAALERSLFARIGAMPVRSINRGPLSFRSHRFTCPATGIKRLDPLFPLSEQSSGRRAAREGMYTDDDFNEILVAGKPVLPCAGISQVNGAALINAEALALRGNRSTRSPRSYAFYRLPSTPPIVRQAAGILTVPFSVQARMPAVHVTSPGAPFIAKRWVGDGPNCANVPR